MRCDSRIITTHFAIPANPSQQDDAGGPDRRFEMVRLMGTGVRHVHLPDALHVLTNLRMSVSRISVPS